jgi:hypothetical protein
MKSRLIASAVLMSQLILLVVLTLGSPCPERCPEDGLDGRCLPGCMTCPCSPRPAGPRAAAIVLPAPRPPVALPPAFVQLAPSDPHSADIFHVPKRHLA